MYTGETRFLIQAQLHLCLRKMHPNTRYNPSWQCVCRKRHPSNTRLLGQDIRLSFASCTLQPPPQQTSPSPWPSAFPPSSPSSGEGRGTIHTVYAGDTRFLIQAQLHLCSRKMHPNTRYNPSWQCVCRKRHPSNTRLLGQDIRLSFASCTLQPPLLQTSPSPCHFVTSPFLSDLRRRQGGGLYRIHGGY